MTYLHVVNMEVGPEKSLQFQRYLHLIDILCELGLTFLRNYGNIMFPIIVVLWYRMVGWAYGGPDHLPMRLCIRK